MAAEPSLSEHDVAAAFDTAVPNSAALRSLAGALAEDAGVLWVGAPPVVGRLVGELVARGSHTFVLPACVSCGRTDRKLHRSTEGGVCPVCRHRQRASACARCGAVKPVASRTEAGEPVCERCRRHTRGQRACGVCAQTAAVAVRGRDGRPDVCVGCYRLPEATCARCGQRRPCNFAADEPICKSCAPRAATRCARCGDVRPPTARWPEGPVCEPCYRAALSHRGRCSDCQTLRRLVDPPGPAAARCAACAGVDVPGGHVCGDCGVEDRLFERGRCVRCALARRAHALLAGSDEELAAGLEPVYEAIVAAAQPYSAHNWLRTGAGAALLAEIAAGRLEATHETLDAHSKPRAADYLRRLLVAHGVLTERDEDLARAERWIACLLEGIDRPADRRLVAAYATWRVLRRMRRRVERDQGPWTPTSHAKNQLGAAVALLDWLAGHSCSLAEASQADIDAWLITGPAAYQARDFLAWASEHGHSQPLTVPVTRHRAGTTLDADARWAILARLLHDDRVDLTDRVAGCLLLCYAQPLSRITAITLDQATRRDDGTTTIRLGRDHIVVPEPLAGLLGELIDTGRRYTAVGAPATSRWLFPGAMPGRPLTPARLGARLGKLGINAREARRAALLHLAAQLPAAVLADLLNLSASAAVGWVNNAGGDWNRYAAALVTQRSPSREQ